MSENAPRANTIMDLLKRAKNFPPGDTFVNLDYYNHIGFTYGWVKYYECIDKEEPVGLDRDKLLNLGPLFTVEAAVGSSMAVYPTVAIVEENRQNGFKLELTHFGSPCSKGRPQRVSYEHQLRHLMRAVVIQDFGNYDIYARNPWPQGLPPTFRRDTVNAILRELVKDCTRNWRLGRAKRKDFKYPCPLVDANLCRTSRVDAIITTPGDSIPADHIINFSFWNKSDHIEKNISPSQRYGLRMRLSRPAQPRSLVQYASSAVYKRLEVIVNPKRERDLTFISFNAARARIGSILETLALKDRVKQSIERCGEEMSEVVVKLFFDGAIQF